MIGSSLPLCYPQIGVPNLFFSRAYLPCLPLDKTYPTGGSRRVFRQFAWLEVGSGKVALPRPAHPRVTLPVRCGQRNRIIYLKPW
jgi:hypothetical protein